jgi:Zc3h12a-like ribonuclease protein
VVDGSNLATEGRTYPSLAQLDEAVQAYALEDPDGKITVVVDASFEHRVDESERETLREAMLNGEVVSPPAGAIGRGDAFVLRIAERTGAVVLSNDSFQEFHGQHPWLFDEGRLIGGKPVPGVGWIFTPRLPIRGPKSRAATEVAKAAKKVEKKGPKKAVAKAAPPAAWPLTPVTPPPRRGRADRALSSAIDDAVAEAIDPKAPKKATKKVAPAKKDAAAKKKAPAPKAVAKEKATAPTKKAAKKAAPAKKAEAPLKKASATKAAAAKKTSGRKESPGKKAAPIIELKPEKGDTDDKRKPRQAPPAAVNAPLSFINFVAAYPIGSIVPGEVISFTSHGAMVDVPVPDSTSLHCYIPLTAMGTPPPAKARQVLKKGETRQFVLTALDAPRRVAELAIPAPSAKKRKPAAKRVRATA